MGSCDKVNLAAKFKDNELCRECKLLEQKLSELNSKKLSDYDKTIILWFDTTFGGNTVEINSKSLKTNCLKISRTSIKRVLNHTKTIEAKQAIVKIINNIDNLKFKNSLPLGATKDLTNPKDIKNIEKKKARAVVSYNYYKYTDWIVVVEVVRFETENIEQIYAIQLSKKRP